MVMRSPLDAFDRRNLLTYLSLLCGTMAVAAAKGGSAPLAGSAIAVAVVADTFDGRFARLFASDAPRRELGMHLDSLADAVTFGLAPVICAILLAPEHGPLQSALLWTSAFAYVACAITRLAFFNVNAVAGDSQGFIGIPVPVAALIWASAMLAHPSLVSTAGVVAAAAAAMVMPVRTPRPSGIGLAIFTCWPLAIAAGHLLRVL